MYWLTNHKRCKLSSVAQFSHLYWKGEAALKPGFCFKETHLKDGIKMKLHLDKIRLTSLRKYFPLTFFLFMQCGLQCLYHRGKVRPDVRRQRAALKRVKIRARQGTWDNCFLMMWQNLCKIWFGFMEIHQCRCWSVYIMNLIYLSIHCGWQHIFGLSAEFLAVLVYLCVLSPVYLEEDEALEEAIQRSLLEEFDGPAVQTLK